MAETKTRINNLDHAQTIDDNDIIYIKKSVPESGRSADQQASMNQIKDYVYPPEANIQTTGLVNTSPQAFGGKKTFQNGIATSTFETTGAATLGAGASVVGDLHVSGNIIQQGESYETEVETLAVRDQIIKTRDGATTGMASNEFTGLEAHKYDGTHEGMLVFGADGVARVGDYTPASGGNPAVDDTQALATREDSPVPGAVQVWDDTHKRLKSIPKGTAGHILTSTGPDSDPEMKPLSGAVLAAQVVGTCDTEGNAAIKDIYLDDYEDTLLPAEMSITFEHKNTYGDTTSASPTHPTARIYNANNVLIGTQDICDSRGHFAGEGCWNDGDDIDFKISGNKIRITNSDIRQANSNMTIKADGSIIYTQWKQIFDNHSASDLSTFSLTESVNNFKELLFVASRSSGSITSTSIVLPVEYVKTLTANNSIAVFGYGDEHIYFKFTDDTTLTRTDVNTLRMKAIFGR